MAAAVAMFLFPPVSSGALEVRVVDPLAPIYDGDSAREAPGGDELLLAAPRNGSATAQVVVIGAGADRVEVEMGALSTGGADLPAHVVEIRYAWIDRDYTPDDMVIRFGGDAAGRAYYDKLMPHPEPGSEFVPVWISVHVPADAAAGTYTGELAVGARAVPVRLTVSPWLCPRPSEYAAHVGVVPSLLAVSEHYGIEHWSEEHWKLVERQMKFMGALGADDLWLHVDPGMANRRDVPTIHFTRDGGGELRADFRVTERYMDMFAEHVGRPSNVILYVWDSRHRAPRRRAFRGIVDGAVEDIPSPEEPGGDRFWGMTVARLARLMQARDWPVESIVIGCGDDVRPDPDTVEAWRRIAPSAGWLLWTHGRGDRRMAEFEPGEPIIQAGLEVGYYVHPYGVGGGMPHFRGGWNLTHPVYTSGRNRLAKYMPPAQWRIYPNACLVGHPGQQSWPSGGFAFLLLDQWKFPRRGRGEIQRNLFRGDSRWITVPGPDGPVATVRFEMLREGLQETEARVRIERALVESELDGDLAEEATQLLTTLANIRSSRQKRFPAATWNVAEYPRWMELTSQLYDMADRVSR